MPPLTPRRRRAISSDLPVLVLDLARGDFLERDREVVLADGLDHRRRELVEGPLTQVVVGRVDLTRALGGDEDRRVVGVDVVEQLVDAGTDHALSVPRTIDSRAKAASW